MHKEHINFTPSLFHSGTPKETSRFSWQCEVMICYVKFAYSVEFDAFGGESKKVATLPAPSGNTPDIEVIIDAAKELIVFSESEGKLLVQQYDDDFDKWIDIYDAFVVTC